jgi:HprK-related kinase A
MAWIADEPAFGPVSADLAYTIFETALNWSIALSDVAPMFLHAAVLERDGRALILPAPSASGKSTLCAALAWRGWRLFSDEMAIFDFDSGDLRSNPRPVSLKNAAIDVVRAIEPRASISRTYRGTPKGDVAYMRPPPEAVARAQDTASPSLVVTPQYVAGAPTEVVRLHGREAFELLTANSVNYATMLRWGFDRIVGMVERCIVCRMTYSDLDAATEALDRLHREAMARSAPS